MLLCAGGYVCFAIAMLKAPLDPAGNSVKAQKVIAYIANICVNVFSSESVGVN
jgi:hypothetical protein